MPGIKNRGTKVHKVDTRYNRKKKKKSLDDELFFEEEQENYTASGGVVSSCPLGISVCWYFS